MNREEARELFEGLLGRCVAAGASDMHLSSGERASCRVDGRLRPAGDELYSAGQIHAMVQAVLDERQQQEFAERMTVDLGHTSAAGERFRLNCYLELGRPAMAVRHLRQDMLGLEELGLPERLRELARLRSGLVLVTGATGSGKSSTLAVLLDEINRNRECHILTVEDPVEFVHRNKLSVVHHREVHADVPCYADAVRAALREDPDVIMVGEMRDLETMQASITAAETGHLVFSTLHTGEAVGAVERFIGAFSGKEQEAARHRISMVLKAVIAQRLVVSSDGEGRLPALELLMVNTAAANLIRTANTAQLYSLMETGSRDGMWTLDQDLARLVREKRISWNAALEQSSNPAALERLINVHTAGGRRPGYGG